jgi:hypothetical protein
MSKNNGKKENGVNAKNNGLGPVAREKYENILRARVEKCIAAQQAKINQYRDAAFKTCLEQSGIAETIATYRRTLEELIQPFGEPSYHSTPWLRDDKSLKQESKVQSGIDAILRGMKELKSVYAEIERLREFESQVAEKVWLAGAPEEIAELLMEIGEPAARALSEESD